VREPTSAAPPTRVELLPVCTELKLSKTDPVSHGNVSPKNLRYASTVTPCRDGKKLTHHPR
jgi:hypothetical protein